MSLLLLARVPALRQKAAPFLRLVIPDPVELVALVRLQKHPPDSDAPVAVTDRPPRPVLPTQQAPAKK
jgi:hypothetical protein